MLNIDESMVQYSVKGKKKESYTANLCSRQVSFKRCLEVIFPLRGKSIKSDIHVICLILRRKLQELHNIQAHFYTTLVKY